MKEQIKTHYEPPRAEVIAIEQQGMLCGSAIIGNNTTESVTHGTFVFP